MYMYYIKNKLSLVFFMYFESSTESSVQRVQCCFRLTGSSPALPVQISEGAEVLAGESGPVNKKRMLSLQHWARAIGYPSSTGLQDDPSPSGHSDRKKYIYNKTIHHSGHIHTCRYVDKDFDFTLYLQPN